jgi:hypothetical protein
MKMFSITRAGRALALSGYMALAACASFNSDGATAARWPDFPETPRPPLAVVSKEELKTLSPETLQKLLDNDQKLKNHAARLEAQITKYRELKKANEK